MHRLSILLVSAALAAAGPAAAENGGRHAGGDGAATHAARHAATVFSGDERDRIDAYFRAHPDQRSQLPPGLARKGKVPPGWKKKLERGQRVPDDVWEHRLPLPDEIKLPPPPEGVIVIRLGERILKVREKTREILDILGG